MPAEQNNETDRKARARRRSIWTGVVLGLVAAGIYVGYFLYKLNF